MKTIIKHPLILLFAFILFASCGGSDDDDDINNLSGEKEIISFSIPDDIEGTINQSQQTVSVIVSSGTDVTNIEPVITVSAGATYSPVGTQDFSSPVVYTVVAEDGTEAEYTVTITEAGNTEAQLLSFNIQTDPVIEATIDEDLLTVTAEVPSGTDVSALVVDVNVSDGATTNITDLDFTGESTLIITSEDGETTTEYTVTITVKPDVALQRAALIDFYNANGGDTNNAFDTWDVEDDGSDISDWDGVNINTEGFVIRLVLVEKDISTIPESFTDLTELNSLNLSLNNLEGFPEVITSLENLTHLFVGMNDLQSLPDNIDDLTMLESLTLYGCSLTSLPASIVNLTNLTTINIGNNTLALSTEQCNFITSLDDYTIDPGVCD